MEKYEIRELSLSELETVDGGCPPALIFLAGMGLGMLIEKIW